MFDISQTNAKESDYPKLFPKTYHFEHNGDLKEIREGLENIAKKQGLTVMEVDDLGSTKGAYLQLMREDNQKSVKEWIELNQDSSPSHQVSTLIHELAHSRLHNAETIKKK
ncbi:ImmA/IrrE family metallo-endopeptidase [Listeria aquatica]|uniref:ImmA/IrrE family metallo-endopeptidase n=1 Tax=Listeria aquatica TaxID=1494960 RepID=UPI0004B1081C|nr:ImmA/IrrE family metallo-endopeptidase [Listeria aquatica]